MSDGLSKTQGLKRKKRKVSIDIVVKQQNAKESAITHSRAPNHVSFSIFPQSHNHPSTDPSKSSLPLPYLRPRPNIFQTGTNNSPQRRTTNIPPTKSPTPATMLTFPGSLSGAKTCVRKKRDHALSFGSTSGPRESCAGVKYAGLEWGGEARRDIDLVAVRLFLEMCACVYGRRLKAEAKTVRQPSRAHMSTGTISQRRLSLTTNWQVD